MGKPAVTILHYHMCPNKTAKVMDSYKTYKLYD